MAMLRWILCWICALLASSSYATTSCGIDTPLPTAFTIASPVTVSYPATVGTLLGSSANSNVTVKCTGIGNGSVTGIANLLADLSGSSPLGTDSSILPTNVAGIGIKLTTNGSGSTLGTSGTTVPILNTQSTSSGTLTFTTTITAQLIITGTITAGTATVTGNSSGSTTLGTYSWRDPGTGATGSLNQSMVFGSGVTVTYVGGCTVNSPSVALPTVGLGSLPSNGATAGRTSFTLTLTCNTSATSIKLQLTDQFYTANTSTNLKNALENSSGGATGIGVQVLNSSGQAITLGAQNVITAAAHGDTTLPFSAQYVRTVTTIPAAGKVTAYATINLFYN